jgi:PAP2 superfamily
MRAHTYMAVACGALIVFCIASSPPNEDWSWLGATAVLMAILLIPAIFWHARGRIAERDNALFLPWFAILSQLILHVCLLSIRFGFPLRDGLFVSIDRVLGFNVAGIRAWSVAHPLVDSVLSYVYSVVFTALMYIAPVIPTALGRRAAPQFFVANATAVLLSLPIIILLPAVGPWVGEHFPALAMQKICEDSILRLRAGQKELWPGVICFPSFHVIWIVLASFNLWSVKSLRIPTSVFSVLILISTVTTGWHYVCDVVAGLIIAFLALSIARRCCESERGTSHVGSLRTK